MKKREILDYYNQQCEKDSNYSLDYELISYDTKLETITLKHKKCGNIFSKHKRLYRLSPRCDNKFCISEFRNNNNIKKYGVENPSQVKEFNEKRKQTFIKRFGTDNPLKNKDVMDKLKKTNLEKYGFENCFQNQEVKEKIVETNLKKYGHTHYLKSVNAKKDIFEKQYLSKLCKLEEVKPLFDQKEYLGSKNTNNKSLYYKFKCKKCGNEFKDYIANGHIPRCYKCYPRLGGTSRPEREMQDWLREVFKEERA